MMSKLFDYLVLLAVVTWSMVVAPAAFAQQKPGALKDRAVDIDSQTALLKQKDVATAIKADSTATDMAKSLTVSLRDRAKALADEKKQLSTLLKQIVRGIDSLA
jgi:hypothetical protein